MSWYSILDDARNMHMSEDDAYPPVFTASLFRPQRFRPRLEGFQANNNALRLPFKVLPYRLLRGIRCLPTACHMETKASAPLKLTGAYLTLRGACHKPPLTYVSIPVRFPGFLLPLMVQVPSSIFRRPRPGAADVRHVCSLLKKCFSLPLAARKPKIGHSGKEHALATQMSLQSACLHECGPPSAQPTCHGS